MLTDAQRAAYDRDGFIVVPDVFSAEDVAELRRVTDEFVSASATVTANDSVYDLEDTHSAAEPRVRRLKAPHAIHPVYMRASRNPKVVELLTDLWGSLRYDSGKLNMKSAGYGAPIEWHQDWAFYPHTNEDLAAVGIMIDDVDMENGPMMVVPGSPRTGGSAARWTRKIATSTCRAPCRASARPARSRSTTSARYTARRPISRGGPAASCCTSIAPPMPGRCSDSRRASRNSTSS